MTIFDYTEKWDEIKTEDFIIKHRTANLSTRIIVIVGDVYYDQRFDDTDDNREIIRYAYWMVKEARRYEANRACNLYIRRIG